MRTSDTFPPGRAVPSREAPTSADASGIGQPASRWTRVCGMEDIPRLGARVVRRAGAPDVAVFRTAADKLFALADRCPHRGGPLSQGIVFGDQVACPLHNTCVELHSGCAVAPDKGEVQRFELKVERGVVYVQLDTDRDG